MAETVGPSGPEHPDAQQPDEGTRSEGFVGWDQPEPVVPRHHDLMRLVNHDAVPSPRRDPHSDQLRVPPPPPGPGSRRTRRRVLEIAQLVVLVLLTTGTGLAVASQLALPGDALYPVKRTTEAVILRLNPGNDGELASQFLERRLVEARERPEYAPGILTEVFEELATADGSSTNREQLEEVTRDAVQLTRDALGGTLPEGASEQAQEAFQEANAPRGTGEERDPPDTGTSRPGREEGDGSGGAEPPGEGQPPGAGEGQPPGGGEGQPGVPGGQPPGADGEGPGPPDDRGPSDGATGDSEDEEAEGQETEGPDDEETEDPEAQETEDPEAQETEAPEAQETEVGADETADEGDDVSGQETEEDEADDSAEPDEGTSDDDPDGGE